jgi:hypothetical protein
MWRIKKGKHLTIPVITVSQQGASTNQLSVTEIPYNILNTVATARTKSTVKTFTPHETFIHHEVFLRHIFQNFMKTLHPTVTSSSKN